MKSFIVLCVIFGLSSSQAFEDFTDLVLNSNGKIVSFQIYKTQTDSFAVPSVTTTTASSSLKVFSKEDGFFDEGFLKQFRKIEAEVAGVQDYETTTQNVDTSYIDDTLSRNLDTLHPEESDNFLTSRDPIFLDSDNSSSAHIATKLAPHVDSENTFSGKDNRKDVVTEINVQEEQNGQLISRKPTEEELKGMTQSVEETATTNSTDNAAEELSQIIKTDEEEEPDFDTWSEDDEEGVSDMETILKDEYEPQQEPKDPKDDDYRKIFHTERKNFSNVQEVKILISETEGDFFDDDDHHKGLTDALKPLNKTNESLKNTSVEDNHMEFIKKMLDDKEVDLDVTTEANTTTVKSTTPNEVMDFDKIVSFIEGNYQSTERTTTFNPSTEIIPPTTILMTRPISTTTFYQTTTIPPTTTFARTSTFPSTTPFARTTRIPTTTTLASSTTVDTTTEIPSTSTTEEIISEAVVIPISSNDISEESGESSTLLPMIVAKVEEITRGSATLFDDEYDDKDTQPFELSPTEIEKLFNGLLEQYDKPSTKTNKLQDDIEASEVLKRISNAPTLNGNILNNTATFSLTIETEDGQIFYAPLETYIEHSGIMVNITWATDQNLNNSIAFKWRETDQFYIMTEIAANLVTGQGFTRQQKHVVVSPDPEQYGLNKPVVIVLKDHTSLTFSNVDFLLKNVHLLGQPDLTKADKIWHVELAMICLSVVVLLAVGMYIVAVKTKTVVTLTGKEDGPGATHC